MSLQVWLPLNGDLHNQGLSNITMTNANATLDNNGKIGSCYSFDGSSDRCYSSSSFDFNSTTISISVWAKIDSTATINGYLCGLSQNNNAAFMLYYRASKKIDVIANGSTIQLNFDVTNYVDSWHHYVVVSTGTKILLYIDNILKGEKNYTATSFQSVWAYLGSRREGADDTGAAYFKGQLNDVRIYNHALSPLEVEKISQGLVLHYQLNDRRIEGTTNLLSAANSFPEPSNAGFSSSNTVQGQYWSQTREGSTYTFSGYINNTSNLSIAAVIRAKKASDNKTTIVATGNYIRPGQKGWTVVSTTFSSEYLTSYVGVGLICSDLQSKLTSLPLVQYLQLEEKDHATPWTLGGTTRLPGQIYDCSGYRNNGTIVGNLTAAAGSPRYKFATQFNDVAVDSICTNNTFSFLHSSPFTVSLWVNIDQSALADDTRNKYIIYQFYENRGGFNLLNLGSNNLVCCKYCDETSTTRTLYFQAANSILQGWHMFTLVCDGSQISSFLDGIKFSTDQHAVTMNGSSIYPVYIGRRNGSAIDSLPEKYSDFRIYATALSDDQVNTLFRTSMIVNSDGTTSPRGLS